MSELTINEIFLYAEDSLNLCAGQPVILSSSFESLSIHLSIQDGVTKTAQEIVTIFQEQSKRFSACGANNSDKFGVLRKNPETGWNYLVELITT